ncbi:hypothetical protein [Sphingomonas profundi]|uniref:hypothetical protein n=1 Tax=Alterirhizorhabdus profundi TaxID=2681549 RepID=UPI0012E6FBF5|nr:hypothetical protein [Sphingomonas profundi]
MGFVLAVAANLLLLLMLLTLAPRVSHPPPTDREPSVFALTREREADTTRAKATTQQKRTATAKAVQRPKAPPAAPVAPIVPQPVPALNMMIVSKDVLDATDSAMRTKHEGGDSGAQSADAGAAGGGSPGVGKAPNGEQMYAAEWYREPTDAELAFYLPKTGRRYGWGEIACRTVANYRVEDCVEIGQSPPGSGLSGAVRQAAWQFRVRPPRIGDKRVIGAWVSIRITYTESGATH